ncbi:uncharacterized protein LOC116684014 isoform X3 [Etheostoma spectabile]|uniref:uncharacterized protein LOC116684014 isoform X3 n=1 Tax=Etheostoma spectabile TaxID=54343 RepID=UPI0013AF009F|nr:uncharacterized protein LOC116684014 isoform X3 [Etheostoma spectabile]
MRQQLRFTEEISIFERAGQERMEGEEAPSHRPRLGPELSWTYSTSCPTDESRSGEDGGRGGSKPQAQTGPRTELDVLYKLSHRRRRRSRRRGKRRRRRTRGTGGGGGGGGGGGERRKRGSFRQTQRTKSGRLRRCRPGASPILCPAPDADFTPVASDNTKALLREVGNHRDFGQFLHADFHWTAPCTSLANPHCVRYTFDVDGVMIQLRHTRGMVAEIYLNLSRVVATLQPRRRGGT